MTPHEPRYPRRATAPSSGVFEQLTRLVYELLDAHDDTARIATGRTSTRAGRLISAICAICSESRAICSRMRGSERAHNCRSAEACALESPG